MWQAVRFGKAVSLRFCRYFEDFGVFLAAAMHYRGHVRKVV